MVFTIPPACRPGAAGEARFSSHRRAGRGSGSRRGQGPTGGRPMLREARAPRWQEAHQRVSRPVCRSSDIKPSVQIGAELEALVLKGGSKTKRRVTKERAKPEAPRPAVTQTPGHPDSTSEAAAAAFRGDQPTSKSWLVGTKPDRLVGPDHICRCRRGQFLVQNATHSQSKKCRPTNSGGICRPTNILKVGWSEEQGERRRTGRAAGSYDCGQHPGAYSYGEPGPPLGAER